MLWGAHSGGLELRKDGGGNVTISGRFPYGQPAVLTDGGRRGRPKKERIGPRGFRYRVERPEEDIHFLVGHDYDRPLASRKAGTLDLTDSDDALAFTAVITVELQRANYVNDFLSGLNAGLILGLSPGFRIPPERVSPNAETVEEEDPSLGMALIRTVHDALLYELSAVTRPAYPEAQIEARSWQPLGAVAQRVASRPATFRWR
ncbi:HK97 family phage prohead protease [Heliomarina baculiformis]|uniref:HK97 family phage prohead protease n=1 Tax=Heliomarina baculiformis TaxID=2872036 RepID=UPI001EE27511|nr:HK97 family phage prohead protease [Heliomarina baculiformis]